LIDATHNDVANDPAAQQLPYEAIISMMRNMAQRLSNSEITFSPQLLIPMLERYAIEFQYNVGPRTWLPDLFIEVHFPYETIISVIQNMWYNNIAPFTGPRKRHLAEHMIYALTQWYEDCVKTNTRLFGSDENANDINDFLEELGQDEYLQQSDRDNIGDLRRKILRAFR
jgi:nuclear pore complex protein Nup155